MAWPSIKIWLFMAFRFVLRHKRKTVATGSFIILGTAVLVFLHGLTVGINDTMVHNSTHLHYGDIFLEFPSSFPQPSNVEKKITSLAPIEKTLFRHRFSALVSSGSGQNPIVFYAVHPESEAETTAIAHKIISGTYPGANKKEILVGFKTARQLDVREGDPIAVQESGGSWLGEFRVSGIFETGIPFYDNTIGYVPIQAINPSVLERNRAELAIFVHRGDALPDVMQRLTPLIPPELKLRSWEALMPDLLQLIEMNEVAMQIIILFVFVLVGFGISNSFILTIVERYREFGILKAMGVTPRELIRLIFLESFIVCFTATIMGLLIGWFITNMFAGVGIDFGSLTSHNRYFIVSGLVKPRVTLASLYWPGIMAIIISVVSSYLPTRIAAKKVTSETLRYT